MQTDCHQDSPFFKTAGTCPIASEVGARAMPEDILRRASSSAGRQDDFASCSSVTCDLALITHRAAFDALEGEWNALFKRAGRPHQLFQNFNWLWHWANHYLHGCAGLSIVTGRRDGRLVMVWPLVIHRIGCLNELSWMGEPVSQYGDVLVEAEPDALDLLRQGWARVKSLDADIVHLCKTRRDAAVFPVLAEAQAISMTSAAAPYLDLASVRDFEAYAQRYSAKRHSSHRRHLRRLQEAGTIDFEQHRSGLTAHDLVGHALVLKRAWLVKRGLFFAAVKNRRFDGFFRDVALDQTRSFGTRVSALRCNGDPIAVEISFECKGHLFGHIISHDIKFEKYGAGGLVANYSIRTAHEQGYAKFDLMAPADRYKLELADACTAVDDWAMPLSRAGELYTRVWLGLVRQWAKNAANAMPSWLGRALATIFVRAADADPAARLAYGLHMMPSGRRRCSAGLVART